jgi:hypothetical protein
MKYLKARKNCVKSNGKEEVELKQYYITKTVKSKEINGDCKIHGSDDKMFENLEGH